MIRNRAKSGRRLVIGIPMLWMGLFFLIPFAVVLKISFSEAIFASPPYTSIVEYISDESRLSISLNLGNYQYLWEDELYWRAYVNSLTIAFFSTLMCLLIGFPVALFIARSSPRWRPLLHLLIIIPFWSSLLIRVYSWMGLLRKDGIINSVLGYVGLVQDPQSMLQTSFAVYIGMVYTYLPFMILPLYSVLERQDASLREAATDLGSPPLRVFRKVTLPLSVNGIIAGSMLVFIPTIGEFVIPSLLGASDNLMIGRVLWDEFFANRDWPVASAVAIVLLAVLLIPIMIFQNSQNKSMEG
ncbi:ABC transporter permease subunit [Ruegeria sp.]|uniref:ABC transporter permease subunit n=1 Tax=Ruegeria sp. TaxID=1879320 RepID=UPI00230A2618|nr:ABC transporter permease subunit [Ruegeria sp.]MDA7964313.1 ABC transporter permease subunit [Ruegeria sp.]